MSGALERSFLADIVANIDDDTPRLVYADWLVENDKEDRAELIRVQIERSRLPAWDAAQVRLRLREEELLKRHGEEWLAELPAIEGAKWEGFRRGIVAEVSFASYEAMRASAHACRAVAPVEAITVRWPRRRETIQEGAPIAELRELSLTGRPSSANEVARVAASAQLSTLRSLTARGLWPEGLGRLVASPHLGKLSVLRMPANNLGNEGIQALVGAASLTALEELDLSGQGVSEVYNDDPIVRLPGMELLAGWAGLAGVRSLKLSSNELGRAGLRTLLQSPRARALKELSVRQARLNGQAMIEFGSAVEGLQLETLDVGENVLKERGMGYIASAPCLHELKSLRLDRCEIPLKGAQKLATKATFLNDLRLLDIGHNHFGPTGLEALLEREPASLHTLVIRDNDLLDNGATLLASSPASDGLLEVDLSWNSVGPPGAKALGEAAHLGSLLVLRLEANRLKESAIATLKASPLSQRLAVLDLGDPPGAPGAPGGQPTGDEEIPF